MLLRKGHIDSIVAEELGVSVKKVRGITTAFLAKISESLVGGDIVVLEAFGRFLLRESKPTNRVTSILSKQPKKGEKLKKSREIYRVERNFRIHFKKSETLAQLLRDKYGPSGRKEKRRT